MLGQIINNYVVKKKLGDGGMGTVYYSVHNRVDREVAIKVLHSNLFTNENIRNRFKNEANALIKLNHPNIVKIFDYVEQDHFACLIMEYINGATLDEYIWKVTGPLPPLKATTIISSVLDAVQYAHDNNIYHRDIKPGNIMITKDGNMVRIMDFGIAKLTDSASFNTTHANTQLGTPFYMSPEQVKGLPYTRLSDVYSLGVTLFEMVTGKCPYQDISNLFELQSKIVNEPLPPTDKYYAHVPQRIQKAIAIATHKDPKQRFQSCLEFKKFLVENDPKPALTREVPIPAPAKKSKLKWVLFVSIFIALLTTGFILYNLNNEKVVQSEPIVNTETGVQQNPPADNEAVQVVKLDSIPVQLNTVDQITENKPEVKQVVKVEEPKPIIPLKPDRVMVRNYLMGKEIKEGDIFERNSEISHFIVDESVQEIYLTCKINDSGDSNIWNVTLKYSRNGGRFNFSKTSAE